MSDLGVTIFLLVCCYPVLPIMAAVMANDAKVKKNIAIRCTLPLTAQHDPRVQEICREYKKQVWRWFFIMTAALIPALLLPRFSLALAYMFIWMLAAMAPSFVLFARYNGRLRALKKENGWLSPYGGTVVAADLGAKPEELGKPLSRWLFIPPLLVSLIPCALAMASGNAGERLGGLILGLTVAVCCIMGLFFYPVVFLQRPDVVDSDSRVNAALTRVRRYNWGKVWIAMAWRSALLAVTLWFFLDNGLGFMIATLVYTFALLYGCLRAECAVRRAQERLPRESGARDYVDEDQYWVWGLFYYNPNDRRTMINDRTGMGMGLNMARPAGKIVMGICAALLFLLLPAMSGWFILMDFTPREARIEDGVLYFERGTEKDESRRDAICSVGRLDDRPGSRRVGGTGMDTLCEGRFDVEGYGNVRISLDPQQDCYVVVLTGGGLTRIFNLMSEAETGEIYAEIEAALKS